MLIAVVWPGDRVLNASLYIRNPFNPSDSLDAFTGNFSHWKRMALVTTEHTVGQRSIHALIDD